MDDGWNMIWVFPKIGVPSNEWFVRENPSRIDDLGVPLFSETPIYVRRAVVGSISISSPHDFSVYIYIIYIYIYLYIYIHSPKQTAKAPETGWLEYYLPFGMAYFQVRAVSFREGNTMGPPKTYIVYRFLWQITWFSWPQTFI